MAKEQSVHEIARGETGLSLFSLTRVSGPKIIALLMFITLVLSITACADSVQSLGGKWYFDADSDVHPFIIRGGMEGDPFIPCNVIAHANNEQFVIAAQKPDASCHWNNANARLQDAANNSGNSVNFWIIDISADKLIGPLSLNEYIHQRQQLNIPDDLQIEVTV